MARPLALDEAAMEVQVAMRDVRLHKARPLWLAAINYSDSVLTVAALRSWRRWERLGTYNAEVARGIVHTPEYDEAMRQEQAAFDAEQDATTAAGTAPTPEVDR